MYQRKMGITLFVLGLFVLLSACERPSSPDFSLEHSIDLPIIKNITYPFLSGKGAIIDTTQESFQDMFRESPDGLVRISSNIDFDFGNFDSMVPVIESDPDDVHAEIGLLEVSFEGRGRSDFQDVTGVPPGSQPSAGSQIMGGSTQNVQVELEVDDFDEGIIESGRIRIQFQNDLGFDVQQIDASLYSSSVKVGDDIQLTNINDGQSDFDFITFQEGDELSVPLSIVFDITWQTQNMNSAPGELVITTEDDDLIFTRVRAVIKEQDFYSDGEIEISEDEMKFTTPQHYIEVEEGIMLFRNIENNIDLDINPMIISFPDILMPPYNPSDTLVVSFEGNEMIPRNTSIIPDREIDIKTARIYAYQNKIIYNIAGYTIDTNNSPAGDQKRNVASEDNFTAEIEIPEMELSYSYGQFTPKVITLTDDPDEDGNLDVFNDEEASISEVEDLETLSDNISNLKFYSPELVLSYETNALIDNVVYAAILGVNADGNTEFLKASSNSKFMVTAADTVRGFYKNGIEIPAKSLLRIEINPDHVTNGIASGNVVFDNENSNISEFISNLPVEIRFIGKSLMNEDENEGETGAPVIFDTELNVDIPMAIGTDGVATYSDTLNTSLADLPGEDDDMQVGEAILSLNYSNKLPLTVDLQLDFLDANDQVITSLPLHDSAEQDIRLRAASINAGTRFSESPTEDRMIIRLDESQLEQLHRTANIRLRGLLETEEVGSSSEVRVRADDYVSFTLYGQFKLITRVN